MYRSHIQPSYMRPNNGQMPVHRPSLFRMSRRNLSRSRNRGSRSIRRNNRRI
jgi:hypothetical protein